MQFKALNGQVYDITTKVSVRYHDFEFNNIDKAVDFLCSAVQSYDDDPETISLLMTVEKSDEVSE